MSETKRVRDNFKGRFIIYEMGGRYFSAWTKFFDKGKRAGQIFWNDQKSGTNFFRMTKMGFLVEFVQFYRIFEAGRTDSVTSKERDEKFQQMQILG